MVRGGPEFAWISIWPLIGFNPMCFGCIPKWWYSQCMTFFFNLFVIMTLFNLINSRKVHAERNKFSGISRNKPFIWAWFLILIGQIFIVTFGGDLFGTRPLPWAVWVLCFLFGFLVLLWQQVLDTIVRLSRCYDRDEAPHLEWG